MTATSRITPSAATGRAGLGGAVAALLRGLVLLAGSAALALVFAHLVGPPRLPHLPPDTGHVRAVLAGSEIPLADARYLTLLAGWSFFLYVGVVLTLRTVGLVVLCGCGATRAAWRLMRVLDRLTLPSLRRLTGGALAGAVVTGAWTAPPANARAVPVPAAALPVPAAPELAPPPGWELTGDGAAALAPGGPAEAGAITLGRPALTYTVLAGDSLWRIAEQIYGDGHRYPEIIAANADRDMPDGEPFRDANLLRPGWVLHLPLPAVTIALDGADVIYSVQSGDSLWRVAAHLLGDGLRWPEIWERNQGRDLGGGRSFTNANVLDRGWRLRLPASEVVVLIPEAPMTPAPAPGSAIPPPAAPVAAPAPVMPTSSTPAGRGEPRSAAPSPDAPSVRSAASAATPVPAGLTPDRDGAPGEDGWTEGRTAIVAAAAGLVAAGVATAAVARHRQGRTSGATSGAALHGHGAGRRGRRRQAPGGEPVGDVAWVRLACRLVLAGLRELDFTDIRVLCCREGGDAVMLHLACPPGDGAALVEARVALGRRLDCSVDAVLLDGEQVALTVSRVRREAAALVDTTAVDDRRLLLVPVGAEDGAVTYLNLAGAGSVAVHGDGTQTPRLVHDWLTTLAAATPAGTWLVAPTPELRAAPAWRPVLTVPCWPDGAAVEPEDFGAALDAELGRRLSREHGSDGAPALLVLRAAGGPGEDGAPEEARWETLVRRGGQAGIITILMDDRSAGGATDPLAAACGARVCFAGAASDDAAAPGTLTLTLPGAPAVALTPVVVPGRGVPDEPTVAGYESDGAASAVQADPDGRAASGASCSEPSDLLRASVGADTDHHELTGHDCEPLATTNEMVVVAQPAASLKATPASDAAPSALAATAQTDEYADAAAAGEAAGVWDGPGLSTASGNGTDPHRHRGQHADARATPAIVPQEEPEADRCDDPGSDRRSEGDAREPTVAHRPAAEHVESIASAQEAAPPRFDVRCFGGFAVELDGVPLLNWKMQKARELLAFLIAHRGTPVPRDVAGEALWPGLDAEQMQRGLGDASYHARRSLRDMRPGMGDAIVTQGQRYHLVSERFRVDLNSFEAYLRRAALLPPGEAIIMYERALARAPGEVFGAEPFEWAEPFRRAHRTRLIRAALTAAQLAITGRDLPKAIHFYHEILARDSVNEEAVRGVMRCLAEQGDLNGVRKAYRALTTALRQSLDDPTSEPLPETSDLLNELLTP